MQKHEQKFTTEFRKWLEGAGVMHGNAAFELKVTLEKSLPFNAVQPHQALALRRVKHGKFSWKIADDSIGVKPFDVFFYDEAQAFVVVAFKSNGRIKRFWLIDIDRWDHMEHTFKKKSVTESDLEIQGEGVWEYQLK